MFKTAIQKIMRFVMGGWKVLLSNITTMLPHLRFCFNFKVNTSIISLVPMLSASEATLPAFGQREREPAAQSSRTHVTDNILNAFHSSRNIIYYRQIGA